MGCGQWQVRTGQLTLYRKARRYLRTQRAEQAIRLLCARAEACDKQYGDGQGCAGHAGVGLGWQTGKLTFTLSPAALISSSSTSSVKSRVLIVALVLVVIDPRVTQPCKRGGTGWWDCCRDHPNQPGQPEVSAFCKSVAVQPTSNRNAKLGHAHIPGPSSSSLIENRKAGPLQYAGAGLGRARARAHSYWAFCTSSMHSYA